jgi:methylated-DNA-[protein]-cysteine S-methyltransferase
MSAFTVNTAVGSLAVTVEDGAVREIRLNATADRRPASAFERRVASELREYAIGRRRRFTVPLAAQGSPFDRQVWEALRSIPYGATRTYAEVAKMIGKPGAARAVGAANGRNPIPIIVPCHRVIAAGGRLGGYGGGLDLKRALLDLESGRAVAPAH